MAKVTGQSVPSEDKHAYEAALELARPDGTVRKRFPKRINDHPLPKKLAQQARFKKARDLFASVDSTERQRWYDNRPVWNSFLWYYNYFIMSSLNGNANLDGGGAGVIKAIQHKTIAMPSGTGEGSVAITAVDPAKSVVMLYGNSGIPVETEGGGLFIVAYPYMSSMAAELVKCKWATTSYGIASTDAANIGITIIEYI